MLHFNILTIFPEFFDSPLRISLMGKAAESGKISFSFFNPRDFSLNRHRHTDDRPYGGGPGMVMQIAPLASALRAIPSPGRILCMSPAGRQFDQAMAKELAAEQNITIICGRYEGIDARLAELFPIEETGVGRAILNGGETAALAIMEGVARFLPDFMGKEESLGIESFSDGLLEHPHYTRPEIFENIAVPEVLLNGNHAAIAQWRRRQSLKKTLLQPDVLAQAPLDRKDAEALASMPRLRAGRNLAFCLVHYPVELENRRAGISSLTNLDIHDISRVSRSYGLSAFYVLTPLADQLRILRGILDHWLTGPGSGSDRSEALKLATPVADFAQMEEHARKLHGMPPVYVAASARWPRAKDAPPPLTPAGALRLCQSRPVIILLGTANGLAEEALAACRWQLRPLRFLNDNHLSVRGAAAIIADRILGDFY